MTALEFHGLRTEDSVEFPKMKIGHVYQKRVDECSTVKMTSEKA